MKEKRMLPILKIMKEDVGKHALVLGDPQRAKEAAGYLEDVKELGYFREYRTFAGNYKGVPIVISSHGVGSAGASICFDELMQAGVKNIIRSGTCGAMVDEIEDGDFIIGTGAIRDDGASDKLIPIEFPAIANRHITAALADAVIDAGGSSVHEGIILSQGFFYPGILPRNVDMWINADISIAATEMEYAVLLTIASLYGVRAGGIFTSDGNLTRESDPLTYDPHRSVVKKGIDNMIIIALEALVKMD